MALAGRFLVVDGTATVQQLLYFNGQANDMLEIIEAECAGSS